MTSPSRISAARRRLTVRRAAGRSPLVEPGAPGTRVGSAAARQHAGDHSLRRAIAKSRAIATSRANATAIVCRDFRPNHTEWRAIAGPRAFNGLCDDEGVPLICPTCQVLAQSVLAGARLLLCMGLFSIFLVGSQSDAGVAARILLEAAHVSEASCSVTGAPDTIRTCDLCLRRATLYPAELRVRCGSFSRLAGGRQRPNQG